MLDPRMPRIDFETRSHADLKEVGAWVYSEHESTEPILLAYETDDGVKVQDLTVDQSCPIQADEVAAWNAFFDYSIWFNICHKKWGWPLPKFFDDMALARNHNLPASLDRCATAMRLPDGKDPAGERLIPFFCKPIASGRHKGGFRPPWCYPVEWEAFAEYCKRDVETEIAIASKLPMLRPEDRDFFDVTFTSNTHGIGVDIDLTSKLQSMVAEGERALDRKIRKLTRGHLNAAIVANGHRALTQYLSLDSVSKVAVKERLATEVSRGERFLLQARQTLGQSSTAKLVSMAMQAAQDGRAKGIIRYHGADTGRDTSLGINLMNLPRGKKGLKPASLIAAAKSGDVAEFMRLAGGDAHSAAAACLRGCLAAQDGKAFLQCDYTGIEPRVSAWYAGDEKCLSEIRECDADPKRPDSYMRMAATLRGIDPASVTKDQRQEGKVIDLASLYGAGWRKVQSWGKDTYGIILPDDVAEHGVEIWRASHPEVVSCWAYVEDAAKAAIRNPGKVFLVGKRLAFRKTDGNLYMRLASGRKFVFNQARIGKMRSEYGMKETILHYAEVGMGGAKKWAETYAYGGSIWNAIVQGTANCLLRDASKRLAAAGFHTVLRVYDEIVCEDEAERFDEFKRVFLTVPEWAAGLPINGAGFVAERYKKD